MDDVDNRTNRRLQDRLTAIREIFERLVHNFQRRYLPSEVMTLDEMVIPF